MVVYPHDFIGPLRPGDKRAPAPKRFQGPVRQGVDVEVFRRTGRSVPSGGSSSRASDRARQAAAEKAAAQAAAQKLLAQQKAQEEAQKRIASAKAQLELNKISAMQTQILRDKGIVTQRISRDVRTKNVLKITEYKQNGKKVVRVFDTVTGKITFNAYAPGKGGGGVKRVGGVVLGSPIKQKEEQIDLDNLSPSQAIALANAGFTRKDIENWGERLTGIEELHAGTKGLTKKLIRKLEREEKLGSKDRLLLLTLQFAIPAQQLIIGLKQLPDFTKSIKNDPKLLLAVPGQFWNGLKQTGAEILALGKVSPDLAIARIAGELFLMKGLGVGFKVLGKVTITVAKRISPFLKPISGGSVILRTATRKGIGKIRVVSNKTGSAITKKYKIIRRIKKVRKVTKVAKVTEIRKFKAAVEYSKQLKRARGVRKLARKKGKTISFGDRDFIEAVAFIEDVADNLAISRAKQFLKIYKSRGGKLGLGQEEHFIKAIQKYVNTSLNKFSRFKQLKNHAKLTEPFQIKLLKIGKIISARKLLNVLKIKIGKLSFVKKMNSIISKIRSKARKLDKLPSRIKRGIAKRKLRRAGRKQFRKTNRYRMEKARKIRKVTIDQLNKAQNINRGRKLVDDLFEEMARRRKIPISNLKYRQLKNIYKKRVSKAIKSGDKLEMIKFRASVEKIIQDMNNPSKAPTVKIIKKGTKSYKTVENFKPETPKGKYVEVKSGNQVLLQEVRQVQKARVVQKTIQIQKLAPPKQVFIIQSVAKQSINLKPLMRYAVFSLSAQAIKNIQKTKQVFATTPNQSQLLKVLQDSAQDFKVLQAIGQTSALRLNVAQAVAQAVRSGQKFRPKLRTKQIQKQKQTPRIKLIKRKNIRTLPKNVMTYAFVVRKAGKNVRLKIPPLTLQDAWSIGAFRLDHDLQRTGTLIPVGMTNKVAIIPKGVRGYYDKHKKKFRRFRVKKGKKFTLQRTIIEKRKYIGDTKSELRELKIARIKARKKTRKQPRRKAPVKRKPVRRKVTRPLRRRKSTKRPIERMTSKQRKTLILKLKKRRTILKRITKRRNKR